MKVHNTYTRAHEGDKSRLSNEDHTSGQYVPASFAAQLLVNVVAV